MAPDEVPSQASMGIIIIFLLIGFLPFDLDPVACQDWIWGMLFVFLFIILIRYLFD